MLWGFWGVVTLFQAKNSMRVKKQTYKLYRTCEHGKERV